MSKVIPVPDFKEDAHEYSIGGVRKPSVTKILGEYIEVKISGRIWYVHTPTGAVIPSNVMQAAGNYGRASHKIFKFLMTGRGVDKSALDPVLGGVTVAIEKWIDKYSPEVIACEEPMYSLKWDFCGTEDLIAKIKHHRYPVVIDLKTGAPGLVGPQTGAYLEMWRENSKYRGKLQRACLHIPKGSDEYTFTSKMMRADDFLFFLHKLGQWNWHKKAA